MSEIAASSARRVAWVFTRPASREEFSIPAIAALGTVLGAYAAVAMGGRIGFVALATLAFFVLSVLGFLLVPHISIALTIPLFAFLPVVKVLLAPASGPLKDLVTVAAITAALAVLVVDRRSARERVPPDRWLLSAVAVLVALYLINVGGPHGIAWVQGVRIMLEPLGLLVAGLALRDPRRTLRWAIPSLVGTCVVVAAYGLFQQGVGKWTLVGWGYSFDEQVQSVGSHLRSFGTVDNPFAYSALLLTGLAPVLLWLRARPLVWAAAAVIGAGIAVSYVRTAALIAVALIGLAIGRRGHAVSAILLIAAVVASMGSILVGKSEATQTTSYTSGTAHVTLNGRTSAWKTALGAPSEWPFGRGVGKVGTAAERATFKLTTGSQKPRQRTKAVDSGYFATVADVGLVGAAVLLAIFARLLVLAGKAISRRRNEGWLAAGFLIVLMLDGVTRSSFTGYPTAYHSLLLVGVAVAAAAPVSEARDRRHLQP